MSANNTSSNPIGRTSGHFTWDSESKGRSWTYYNGIMMDAFLMLDPSYFSNVDAFYNANISTSTAKQGDAYGYVNDWQTSDNYYRYNELDSIPPTRALFDLIRGGSGNSEKYKTMISYVYNVMKTYEVIPYTSGNFIHKSSWTTYKIGLDGLYMAQPFFMELAKAIEDGKIPAAGYKTPSEIYQEVADRLIWVGNNMYSDAMGLYHHGWGPDKGLNGHFWLRGIGWYAAALVDVLDMLPETQSLSSRRGQLLTILNDKLFAGMILYQDHQTGLWRNVVDKGRTQVHFVGTTNNVAIDNYNELETSGSALMAYAMIKAYNLGLSGEEYGRAGMKAFNGVVNGFLTGNGLQNVYKQSGVEETDELYLKHPFVSNEAKGVGPLFMAASVAESCVIPPQAADLVYGQSLSESALTGGEAGLEGTFTWVEPDFVPTVPGGEYQVAFGDRTFLVHVSVEKAEPAYTPPLPVEDLVYTGEAQVLIYAGETEDGVVKYKRTGPDGDINLPEIPIGGETVVEDGYRAELPTATEAGTYTVWYKVEGDGNHTDSRLESLSVSIAKASPLIPSSLEASYGMALSEVALPTGWAWDTPQVQLEEAGEKAFSATFKATKNYVSRTEMVSVTVAKALQATPAAPVLEKKTQTKIVLHPVDGAEYSLDGQEWQAEAVFSGLGAGQTYTFYLRMAEDENHEASEASMASYRTLLEPMIILPADLKELRENAFQGCTFEAVRIPEGVLTIDPLAFADCENLVQVEVPGSVAIPEGAFGEGVEVVILDPEEE